MKKFFRPFVIASAIVLPTVFFAVTTSAQTATANDPAVLAAQNQQAIADAQLKILLDQQASLTGLLPASSAAPNSGAFTVTGSTPFPSQKIAYEQLEKIAHGFVTNGDTFENVSGVVMYDSGEINNLLNYNALLATLTLLDGQVAKLKTAYIPLSTSAKDLEKLQTKATGQKDFAATLLPGLVLGSLKTVTDIIGMFRTNTTVANNSFSPDDTALMAVVGRELLAAGKGPVYIPSQMPLSLKADYNNSKFIGTLKDVQDSLSNLQTSIAVDQANLQQLSDALGAYIAADQTAQANNDQFLAEIDAAKKAALKTKQASLDRATAVAQRYVLALYKANPDDTTAIDPPTANVDKAVIDHLLKSIAIVYAAVSSSSTALGAVQNSLVTVSATGTSSLTAIIRAEALLAEVTGTNTRILSVKTSVLGGAVVTRQNLFTGGHLFYTGGAIVNFTIFDATGKVLHSGVLVSDDKGKNVKY